MNFSQIPLSLASWMGVLLTFVAVLMILFIIVRKTLFGDPVAGWPSLVCIMLLIGGLQFFCIGIIGQYISKMYLEVKNRPKYIIMETEESLKKAEE